MDTKWESDHLWLCLLALGFRPKCHSGLRVGRDMFVKPNNRAFPVVAVFLFTKLDKRRARLTFKHFGFKQLSSPKFRKHCCLWLREIANQEEKGFPRITPSALICPGGARFVHMAYCFARYVMIEDMKKLSVGAGIPFAEAVKQRPKDMYIAKARHRVAYNKLLQILQREDFVIQEYGKKAQVLIREINWTKSEYAVMWKQFCGMKQNDQSKNDTTEKIQKVRSMWTIIVEMLTSLKKEKEIVDSVLEDCVHPCILDGTDVVLSVPGFLTYRVETEIHGYCTGNLYEDGKLNFLTVIQLLNEALRTLRDEYCPCELKELHRIEDVVTSYKKALQDLKTNLRRVEQHCEQKRQSISRKQEIWESKWKTILGQCPFNLIFKDELNTFDFMTPDVCADGDAGWNRLVRMVDWHKNEQIDFGFVSVHPPVEVEEPASQLQSSSSSDEDENTVSCQSYADNYDSRHEECHGKDDGSLETMMDTTLVHSRCDFIQHGDSLDYEAKDSLFLSPSLRSSSVPSLSEASEDRDLLIENPLPPKILKNGKKIFPTSEMEENAAEDVIQPKCPVKKEDLVKARDELAEEVAKSVMSESPDSGEEKRMVSDDLIRSLFLNPFLTSKQRPRTPENLLTEIRSSWRKAIQTECSLDIELSSTKVVTEESSMGATSSMQEDMDSTLVCSDPAYPVSDFDPPVSEMKSQLSSIECSPQEQLSISHTFEPSVSKPSGIQESERTESEELDCSALSGRSVEDVSQTFRNLQKSVTIPDTCSKSGSRTNTLPSEHCRSFLMDEMLCWNVSLLNSVGHETTDMGILDETLPGSDSIDLSLTPSSDSAFYTMYNANIKDGLENNEDNERLDRDVQSLSNSFDMLKKTVSEGEEELHPTRNGDESESYRSELCHIPAEREGNYHDPSRDEGFTKVPLPNSPNESKYSLSSLLVSCQQKEEMASLVHEVPLDLLHKLKGNS